MSEHQSYIRIMSDIIDSGIWAKLSSAAKTLYPVLLKFSDFHFKPVWPNTETLMGLTGFQTSKSIREAKKDLQKNGLIHVIPGSGRVSTRYYFRFDYPGSKITPLGDENIPLREEEKYSPEGEKKSLRGDTDGNPNHINITINNNQNNETKKEKNLGSLEGREEFVTQKTNPDSISLESLLEDFGSEIFRYAYEEAEKRNLQNNLPYLKTICRNRVQDLEKKLKNNHHFDREIQPNLTPNLSWKGFLEWVDFKLSSSSAKDFRNLEVELDGKMLCILSSVTPLQKNIIESYFSRVGDSEISLVFASPKLENRIF